MSKIAVYPGSFNPWHKGHLDILKKALAVFDHIIIAVGYNPLKDSSNIAGRVRLVSGNIDNFLDVTNCADKGKTIEVVRFSGLLVDFAKDVNADAIIRGLRNGHDLQYEMNQQYWNEDLGLIIPIVYFITDRELGHISSSTIRSLNSIKVKSSKQ